MLYLKLTPSSFPGDFNFIIIIIYLCKITLKNKKHESLIIVARWYDFSKRARFSSTKYGLALQWKGIYKFGSIWHGISEITSISLLKRCKGSNFIIFSANLGLLYNYCYARIHHRRLKKFNPSSIARFLNLTIKLNLHISRIDFNRYSPFNFVCKKSWIENCLVFDVTHWQEIWLCRIS